MILLDMVHNCRGTELPRILYRDIYIASQVAAASSNIIVSLANFSLYHFKDIFRIIVLFLNPLNYCSVLSEPPAMGLIDLGHEADPVLTRVVEQDKVKWWQKPNLRLLYLLLYPTCMGIEITSGFDSQMINGLQFIPAWNKCQ